MTDRKRPGADDAGVSRRAFLQRASTGSAAALLAGALGLPLPACKDGDESGVAPGKDAAGPGVDGAGGGASKPNILLITTDQEQEPAWFRHDADWLDTQLPGRAWLRKRGVHFTNAHCNTLPCSPSRASLYTGLYPHQHQVYGNNGFDGNFLQGFPTTARLLREAHGYATHYIGKSHLAAMSQYDCKADPHQGMDVYGFTNWVTAPSGPPFGEAAWPEKVCYDSPGIPGEAEHEDVEFAEAAVKWLGSAAATDSDKPWFTVISLVNPHDIAWYPRFVLPKNKTDVFHFEERPGNWESRDELKLRKPTCQSEYQTFYNAVPGGMLPETGPQADEKWRGLLSQYMALLKESDGHLVAIIGALLALPAKVRDNLVVFFTSDHGDLAGAHGQRGKGSNFYQEQMNVPLYLVDFSALSAMKALGDGPDKATAGRYVEVPGSARDQLVCHLDMATTLVTLGADQPQGQRTGWKDMAPTTVTIGGRVDQVVASQMQGENLEPLLAADGAGKQVRDHVLFTHDWFVAPTDKGPVAVTTAYHIVGMRKREAAGDWKLNLNCDWRKTADGSMWAQEEDAEGDGIRAKVVWHEDIAEAELYDMKEPNPDLREVNNLVPPKLPQLLVAAGKAQQVRAWAAQDSLQAHQAELQAIAAQIPWTQKVTLDKGVGGKTVRKLVPYSDAEKAGFLGLYARLEHELVHKRVPEEIRKPLPQALHPIQVAAWKRFREGRGKGECEAMTIGKHEVPCVGM